MKLNQLIGKYAIRTAPAKGQNGSTDISYSNIDPLTDKPGRYVKRFYMIDRIEKERVITTRVSLVTGERRQEIIEGEKWFDDAWALVSNDGRVEDYYMTSIYAKVKTLITDKLGIDDSEIVLDSYLRLDLGIDEIDLMEIMMELEKTFKKGFISEDQIDKLNTVGDIVNYFEK